MELVASSVPGEVDRFDAIEALVQRSVLTRLVCQELITKNSDGKSSSWRTNTALAFLMQWIGSLPECGEHFQASFGLDSMTVPDDCLHMLEEIRDGAAVCDDLLMLQSADTASDVMNDTMRIEMGLEVYWRKHQSPAWPPHFRLDSGAGQKVGATSMAKKISITGVSERDIDLLLLEEFQSSPSFRNWFVGQTLGSNVTLGQCIGAERSVTHSIGESDLEVSFLGHGDIQTRLMIENKIGAGLQPLQAKRYLERGQEYVAHGKCSAFHTIIVAPSRYFASSDDNKGFGYRITYEQILSWFQQEACLGERRHYKELLLQSAIEKGTLGYQPEEDSPTTDFWHAYWLLTLKLAPELEMNEPLAKPSGSGFIHFRPATRPSGVDIVHKMNHGFVDLHLRGMGKNINHVRTILEPLLEEGMKIASAAGSAAVRFHVPKLKPFDSMSSQEENVCACIDKAKYLMAWSQKHASVIKTVFEQKPQS